MGFLNWIVRLIDAIKGTLLAGSTITVRGFKGSVAWTQIDYVVHRKELEAYAKRK